MMPKDRIIPKKNIYFSKGIHPWWIKNEHLEENFSILEKEIQSKNIIAIGECGLDKLCEVDFAVQLAVFKHHIQLAQNYKTPLIIHCVRSISECLHALRDVHVPIIFHGVNYSYKNLKKILDAGYHVSFGKSLLYNKTVQSYFSLIPQEQLFLETDDADISIVEVYTMAAQLLNIPLESLKFQIFERFKQVFL